MITTLLIIIMIIGALLVPPLIFWSLGKGQKEIGKNDKATLFYILAIVYLIIGLGICGGMMVL